MIAQTPPMGWNSWDCYGAAVTEGIVRRNAEYMAEKLKPFGWEYVVVDIQWYQPTAVNHSYEPFSELTMDEYGRLTPAVNRFPSAANGAGFRPLADYIHSLGLKFGIHIMRGMPRMAAHRHLPIADSPYAPHGGAPAPAHRGQPVLLPERGQPQLRLRLESRYVRPPVRTARSGRLL